MVSTASRHLPGMTGTDGRRLRNDAIRSLQAGLGSMVYAIRTKDGLVKIGVTTDLIERPQLPARSSGRSPSGEPRGARGRHDEPDNWPEPARTNDIPSVWEEFLWTGDRGCAETGYFPPSERRTKPPLEAPMARRSIA